MSQITMKEMRQKMDATVEALKKEFSGLRTGRASTSLLDPIKVPAYGGVMPINQIGSVSAPEARLLTIQVWDQSLVSAVEKAIRESDLGLNPQTDGQLIRINIPELSEERRKEMTKVAGKYAEQARISVRNARRDAMDAIKSQQKNGDISEDDYHRLADDIQKETDQHIETIDEMLTHKEQDIMQV